MKLVLLALAWLTVCQVLNNNGEIYSGFPNYDVTNAVDPTITLTGTLTPNYQSVQIVSTNSIQVNYGFVSSTSNEVRGL